MGLGKTAQTISFLGVLRTMCGIKHPHLIVCPASLIQNWAREFRQWCPGVRIILYHGKSLHYGEGPFLPPAEGLALLASRSICSTAPSIALRSGKERDSVREALKRWRKKVRVAYNEGLITELPPGMLVKPDEDDKDEAAGAFANEFLEPNVVEEDEDAAFDEGMPVGGLVVSNSGEGGAQSLIL